MIGATTLIEDFYKDVKLDYPNLSLDDFKKICRQPFSYLRSQIEDPNLPEIRLKYFGKFIVYPNRARAMLKYSDKSHLSGRIDDERYNEIQTMLKKYLDEED